jgi:uncharacterized membrane protein
MRPIARCAGLALLPAVVCFVPAFAQEVSNQPPDPATGREAFLAGTIAVMMLCGLLSFLLLGRIAERTHVSLAMLSVLAGAFGLLVLFGGALFENPVSAVFALLTLIALFKFMGQFESGRGPDRKRPKDQR